MIGRRLYRRSSIPWTAGVATVALTLVLLPAAAPAARTQADELKPVKFGLGYAKEGQLYSTSIAGAASGGVRPYHCAPAESFGPLWAWLHVSSNCVISGKAPILPAGTSERLTVLTFKLTDSETPPKTVTLYPMAFSIHAQSADYPFDGTWRLTETATETVTCPGAPPISKSGSSTVDLKVVHGVAAGHALAISIGGTTATVTGTQTVAGVTTIYRDQFTVAGAATSVRGTVTTSGSVGGCSVKGHGTESGSRISP